MPAKLPAKQKGEWAEVCFAAEILRRGWRISRPYGDSAPYDCIVDVGAQVSCARCLLPPASRPLLWRIQVKSVAKREIDLRSNHHSGSNRFSRNQKRETRNHRYHVTVGRGRNRKRRYSAEQADFLAVLVVPHRTWYIIPVRALRRQVSISLWGNRVGRLERYREAWHLLTTAD